MTKKDLPEISPEQEKAIVEGKEVLASKQDALLQLGQIQAFNFIGKLVTVTELKIVQNIKESKSYKGLTYKDETGKPVTVTTWEECCQHILNTDYQNLDNRLRNLQQFGEEFFEQAQQMKLGYRDLRALRQLPDEDQTVVIESEAVESGDKEAVKDLIAELKAKHQKESTELKQMLNNKDADLKAARKGRDDTVAELQQTKEQLHKKKFGTQKWQHDVRDFITTLHKTHNQINEGITQLYSLIEQLTFIEELDDAARDMCINAFYADNRLLVDNLAACWQTIDNQFGHLADGSKLSSEYLAQLGFEGEA